MTGTLARLRGRLTFANVTAALALFIALGGTSYAAARNSIGSAEIRTGAVGKSEIRTGGVGKSEIRTGAVSASELRRNGVGPSEVRAGAVGPTELRDDAVGPQHLADNAVGTAAIANGTIAVDDLATATRNAFQAPLGHVTINAAGGGVSGNATAAARTATGVYTVTFANDIHECSYAATLANVGNETAPVGGTVNVTSSGANSVVVRVFDAGTPATATTPAQPPQPANSPFHLLVAC
jgi:hypothetical protein